ncbi:MAG: GNAT family N-acetyltransferase [Acidobacteria bacterium]|nr:GNAT family N-acetyltransferase [Acidobacteriota bacterium]
MPVVITPASNADVPFIVALLERCTLPVAGWRDHVKTTLVARDGLAIVGSIALEVYGESALLRSAAVEVGSRGRGLGSALTKAVLDLARSRGIRSIYLLTETAGGFFPRFGFQRITREEVPEAVKQSVEFTSACPATALVMKLILDGDPPPTPDPRSRLNLRSP